MISRFFDLFLALTLLIIIIGPSILLSLLIKFSSKGPIFHWSKRVGKENKIFLMQLNRFMWEDVEKGVYRKNKRIRTILKFENVIGSNSKAEAKIAGITPAVFIFNGKCDDSPP